MKGISWTVVLVVAAALAVAALAHASDGPTRQDFVAQVEPICQANTLANQRILQGAREKVKQGKLRSAGRQFNQAAKEFATAIGEIAAVPRPPADEARLTKWIGFLKTVDSDLRTIGKALKAGNRPRASLYVVLLKSHANAANNVGYAFGFNYCRLSGSQFS